MASASSEADLVDESRRSGPVAVVGVSISALAASTFSIIAVGTLAPELQENLGLSRTEVGLLTSLVFFGSVLTSRPAGRLTDSVGPARVLGVSMALFSASMAVVALVPSAGVLMLAVFVAGLAYGGVNPPTNAVVAGRLSQRMGLFLSLKQTGVPLGGMLAGVVLPPIAVAFSWQAGFAVAGIACASVVALTPLLRHPAVEVERREETGELSRIEMAALGLFGFVMAGIQWGLLTYLVLYLTEQFNFGLALAGLALAMAQGLGALARLLWGWLSDATGHRLAILLAMSVAQAATLALLAENSSRVAVWPLVALTGFTVVGWNGAYYALLAERAGPTQIGRVSGDALMFIFAGPIVAPPVLGLLVDSLESWRLVWLVCSVVVCLAAVLLWRGLRRDPALGGAAAR